MPDLTILGHIGFVLITLSYAIRDIIWLRVLAIPASICFIVFYILGDNEHRYIPIFWNCVFIIVNSVQLLNAYAVLKLFKATDEIIELSKVHFPELSRIERARLFRIADERYFEKDETIANMGDHLESVYLIVDGEVEVTRGETVIGSSQDGTFLGEISFLSGAPGSATLVSTRKTRMLVWDQEKLRRLLSFHPNINRAINNAFASDLSRKLVDRASSIDTETLDS